MGSEMTLGQKKKRRDELAVLIARQTATTEERSEYSRIRLEVIEEEKANEYQQLG